MRLTIKMMPASINKSTKNGEAAFNSFFSSSIYSVWFGSYLLEKSLGSDEESSSDFAFLLDPSSEKSKALYLESAAMFSSEES